MSTFATREGSEIDYKTTTVADFPDSHIHTIVLLQRS